MEDANADARVDGRADAGGRGGGRDGSRYLRAGDGCGAAEGAARARMQSVIRNPRLAVKPPIPGSGEWWTPTRAPTRDYVDANAREVIALGTREYVANGLADALEGKHSAYGRVPEYLIEMNRAREAEERARAETVAKNNAERAAAGRMREDERLGLIESLREEHARLTAAYQKLPFVVDTPNRRARKEAHELKLAQLERDIDTLRARVVFIDA